MFVTIPPRIMTKRTPERDEKIFRSQKETEDLNFRAVHCPYCEAYLFDVFEDIQGHLAVKCNKCKGVVPINPAYFRRYSKLGNLKKEQENLL